MHPQFDDRSLAPTAARLVVSSAGRVALGASVALLLAARALDGPAAAVVAGAGLFLFGLVLVSAFGARLAAGRVRVEPGPGGISSSGDPVPIEFTVVNRGARTVRDLAVIPWGLNARPGHGSAFVDELPAGDSRLLAIDAPAHRRGIHPMGRIELSTSAPLGLVRSSQWFELPGEALVVPRAGRFVRPPSQVATRRVCAETGAGARGEEQEFHALRAWRPGDSLRTVHWKASAKRGMLISREFRGEPRPPVRVVLDTRVDRLAQSRFEVAVSLAATLVSDHLRAGHVVRMSVVGAEETRHVPARGAAGASHTLAILAAVSRSKPSAEEPRVAFRPGGGEHVIVVQCRGAAAGADAPRTLPADEAFDVMIPAVVGAFRRSPTRRVHHEVHGDGSRAASIESGRRTLLWLSGCAAAIAAAAPFVAARGADSTTSSTTHWLGIASLAVAAGIALRTRDSVRHPLEPVSSRCAWIGAGTAAAVSAIHPSAAGIALAAAGFVAAAAAQSAWSGRGERIVARSAVRDERDAPVTGCRDRAIRGAAASVSALLLAALLLPLALWTRPPSANGTRPRPGGGEPSRNLVAGSNDRADDGSAASLYKSVLLELAVSRDGVPMGNLGPVYVRGLALDRVDRAGHWTDDLQQFTTLQAARSGASAGMIEVGAAKPAAGDFDYLITGTPLGHPRAPGFILHLPATTTAIRMQRVRGAWGGTLTAGLTPDAAGRATVVARGRHPGSQPTPGAKHRVRRGDPALVELPESPGGRAVAARLAAEAVECTAEARHDAERVAFVCSHLRETVTYAELDGAPTGVESLRRLLDERRGTCEEFSQAAAVMLRSLGIPARVANGFLVRRFDAERGSYYAMGRDYHSWVEVPFEGLGWIVYDPTPDDRVTPPPPAASSVAAEDPVPSVLDGNVARVAEWVQSHPATSALIGLVSALLCAILAGAVRVAARSARMRTAGAAQESSAWDELLAAVSRTTGRSPLRGETTIEFAVRADRAERLLGNDALAELPELARRQQESRFGRTPLDADTSASIARLSSMLAGAGPSRTPHC